MTTTKERIVDTTAELFRRQGYHGTGLKQIVAEARAPFGSLYHFFPGGKEHLGAEVIKSSGLVYQELVVGIIDAAPDIVTGVQDAFDAAAEVLRATDFADACPIATVALEVASTNDTLRQATADVFDGWIEAGTERFADVGISRKRARELTLHLIMALEGAFLLSRAKKDTEPMKVAGAAVVAAVRAAVPPSRRRRRG